MLPVPKLFSLDKISIEGKALAVVLSCKNSENELVQAATAIVQEEDVQGCQYLLQNCKKHPEMHEFLTSPETTCFYAGEQEAMAALAAETPRVQQRWCLRHIVSKYTPDISPGCFSTLLDAARAPTFELFKQCMDMVNTIEQATFEAVMSIPLPYWTHHASLGHTVILNQVTSHASELASGFLNDEATNLPILKLMEHIARSTSQQFEERATQLSGYEYTKFAVETYQQELFWKDRLTACAVGYSMYLVGGPDEATGPYSVSMTFRDQGGPECACTCAFPARFRIPCRHVFAAAKVIARVDDCIEFVDENYGAARFSMLYPDKPGNQTRSTVYDLEPDTLLQSTRRIDDYTSHLGNLEPLLRLQSVDEEEFGEVSVPNSSIPIDSVTHEQPWTSTCSDGSPTAEETAFTAFNAVGLDVFNNLPGILMHSSNVVGPAGAFAMGANDNSPWNLL